MMGLNEAAASPVLGGLYEALECLQHAERPSQEGWTWRTREARLWLPRGALHLLLPVESGPSRPELQAPQAISSPPGKASSQQLSYLYDFKSSQPAPRGWSCLCSHFTDETTKAPVARRATETWPGLPSPAWLDSEPARFSRLRHVPLKAQLFPRGNAGVLPQRPPLRDASCLGHADASSSPPPSGPDSDASCLGHAVPSPPPAALTP